MFMNNNPMNKIEYMRNKRNGLWVAHAHHVTFDKHIYATGRTMSLLAHNINQNITNARLNHRTFVWDEHASDNIYLDGASELFLQRYVNIDAEKIRKGRSKTKTPVIKDKEPVKPAARDVITREVDGVMVVYELKEIARYNVLDV